MERAARRADITAAYTKVFLDLINNGPNLFRGFYDAAHGNEHFMYGVNTVLEYMENYIDVVRADGKSYSDIFIENMAGCQKLADEDKYRQRAIYEQENFSSNDEQ